VIAACAALYLNVFVPVVQSFEKVPALAAAATAIGVLVIIQLATYIGVLCIRARVRRPLSGVGYEELTNRFGEERIERNAVRSAKVRVEQRLISVPASGVPTTTTPLHDCESLPRSTGDSGTPAPVCGLCFSTETERGNCRISFRNCGSESTTFIREQ
jgi:hypothetical protein